MVIKKNYKDRTLGVLVAPPNRRYWVSLDGIPKKNLEKLAMLGLAQKIRRIVMRGNRSVREREETIQALMETLRQGKWKVGIPTKREVDRWRILQSIRDADNTVRERIITNYRRTGVFKKFNITEADIQEALENRKPLTDKYHLPGWDKVLETPVEGEMEEPQDGEDKEEEL